jgi:hypothetical protein
MYIFCIYITVMSPRLVVVLFLFLFFLFPLIIHADVSLSFIDSSVQLKAAWSPRLTNPYQSTLIYSFCSVNPSSAKVLLGRVSSIRFVHYLDAGQPKYDQQHPLPNKKQLNGSGCLTGTITINEPFYEIKSPAKLVLLLLNDDQSAKTPDKDIHYRLSV